MNSKHKCSKTNHRWSDKDVWGIGGTAILESQTCKYCKMRRARVYGDIEKQGNRNHGWHYEG